MDVGSTNHDCQGTADFSSTSQHHQHITKGREDGPVNRMAVCQNNAREQGVEWGECVELRPLTGALAQLGIPYGFTRTF